MLSSWSAQIKQEKLWYSTKKKFEINLQCSTFKEYVLSEILMQNVENWRVSVNKNIVLVKTGFWNYD